MIENGISYKVRGILFDIYNKLGPGLYESVYEVILAYELMIKLLKINVKYLADDADNIKLKRNQRNQRE